MALGMCVHCYVAVFVTENKGHVIFAMSSMVIWKSVKCFIVKGRGH